MKTQNTNTKGERSPMKRRPGLSQRARATLKQRWRAALHEAGHIAAERRVKKAMYVGAYILNGGGAFLTSGSEDNTFEDALVAAAGSAAEELADQLPEPPMLPSDKPQLASAPDLKIRARMAVKAQHLISDDVWLAQWAIRGIESKPPEEYVIRIHRIRREADCFVWKHQAFIIRLAQRLYVHGLILSNDVEEALRPAGQHAKGESYV
jgi:hypothetical protein